MFGRIVFDSLILLKNLLKVSFQIIHGVWKIYKLQPPIVTVFGGTLVDPNSAYAMKAHIFGHRLIEKNISVITGGGPGIMQAVACGAVSHQKNIKAKNLSITVKGLYTKEPVNPCAHDYLIMDYFFARKWLMINYSVGFVIFPGGFGTLDEFAEIMTLLQTKTLLPQKSVILIDKQYWKPLIDWIDQSAIKQGLINESDKAVIQVIDDLDEALGLIYAHCKECMEYEHKITGKSNL